MSAESKELIKRKANKPASRVDLAQALKLRFTNKLSYREIGRYLGVSGQAVEQSLNNFLAELPTGNELEAFKDNRLDLLNSLQLKAYKQLMKGNKLSDAKALDLAKILGISYDKTRLEEGKSTQNIAYKDITAEMEQIERQILELKKESDPEPDENNAIEAETRDL